MAWSGSWDEYLRGAGVPEAAVQASQLTAFESDILRFAGARNLVSRRDPERQLRAMLAEAVQALRLCEREAVLVGLGRIGDLGSGAGIPGIPWAILRGGEVDFLERRTGRAEFLEREIRALKLSGCRVFACDARALPEQPAFAAYRFLLAKAVAQPMELLSWVPPLIAPDGWLCLFGRPNSMQGLDLPAMGWEHRELALAPDPSGPDFPPSALQLLRRPKRAL